MAKHNVKQTRGTFKLVGKVKGTQLPRFFKNMTFESGSEKNQMSFGVQTSNTNESYVSLEGFAQKVAKFNKYDKDTKKNLVEETSWATRFDFEKQGYNPMFGTRINLTDDKDSTITLFQYDACEQIKSDLEDGMSVFIEGNTAFSSYTKDGEKKSYKNLDITKIYKQKSPIDFNDAKFSEENRFQQEFIFMSVEQEIDFDTNKPTGRAIVYGKIVTKDTVEDTQFILEDKTLISNFRSRLKPYYALKAVGRLVTKVEEETPVATDSDDWGSDEGFDDQQHTVKFKEWVITKVYGESIDKDTYSEAVLASITQAEEDFGTFASEEDEDDVWGE